MVHAYQTFSGHLILLAISNDINLSDDKIKQIFLSIHKVLCLEMQNPFYRDGAGIESEGVQKDIGASIFAI